MRTHPSSILKLLCERESSLIKQEQGLLLNESEINDLEKKLAERELSQRNQEDQSPKQVTTSISTLNLWATMMMASMMLDVHESPYSSIFKISLAKLPPRCKKDRNIPFTT